MGILLNIFKSANRRFFPPIDLKKTQSNIFLWREQTFYWLLWIILVFGFIVYIPSLYLSITEKSWNIIAIDTIALVGVIFLVSSKKLSYKLKVNFLLGILFLLGISLVLLTGPFRAGFICLFSFPVLAGAFRGIKAVLITTAINLVSLTILGIWLPFPDERLFLININARSTWFINIFNFIALETILAISLSFIIKKLDDYLKFLSKTHQTLEAERKELIQAKKKAEESNKLKSTFVANLSHEIRSPMNSIIGFASLMERQNIEEEKKKEFLSIIKNSGNQLLHLINDIIDISKIETNELSISKKTCGLHSLLRVCFNTFKSQAAKKNHVSYTFNYELETDATIVTDPFRFTQIINNFLSNAIKFTCKGEVKLGIRRKGVFYETYVSDSGVGIPQKDLTKIFDKFYQVEKNERFNKNGAGLGLSISKALAEMLGGHLKAESKKHKGTTFSLFLPIF